MNIKSINNTKDMRKKIWIYFVAEQFLNSVKKMSGHI